MNSSRGTRTRSAPPGAPADVLVDDQRRQEIEDEGRIWTDPISRAASARSRPSSPVARAIASTMSRAASRFCAGRAPRGMPQRRRGSRSPRSRRAPGSAAADRRPIRARDTAAPRFARRDRDRAACRHPVRDRIVLARTQDRQRSPPISGSGCVSSVRRAGNHFRVRCLRSDPGRSAPREIRGRELRGQDVGGRPLGHRGGATLGVQPVAVNAVLDGADVFRPEPPGQRGPDPTVTRLMAAVPRNPR